MAVVVRIPTPLRSLTKGASEVQVSADSVTALIEDLERLYPGLRERLMERHKQVGPLSQYHDLKTIDAFDVRDRIGSLKPKLLLLRGLDDHGQPPEYELEIHQAVPGSRYVKLSGVGHFPPTEDPARINPLIEEFVASLA